MLGGEDDKTNRLAIAYFESVDPSLKEFDKWVNVHLPNGIVVKAEIASLAERLKISPKKIVKLARADQKNQTHTLEQKINNEVNAYKDDLKRVKKFYQLVSNFLVSPQVEKQKLNEVLSKLEKFSSYNIKNKIIQEAYIKCKGQLLITLNKLKAENFENWTIVKNWAVAEVPPPSPDIIKKNIALAKGKILSHLKEFQSDLLQADKNLSIGIAGPIVISKLWENTNFVLSTAVPINSESSGKLASRLQLIPDTDFYSVLTDGKIYETKPQATANYVPFSKDGETWVLLSVPSLSSRFRLTPEYIRRADSAELGDAIKEFIKARNDINELVDFYNKGNVSKDEMCKHINRYIENLDINSAYYEVTLKTAEILKDIIISSDTKAKAIAVIEYMRWDPRKDRTKIKMTPNSEIFKNYFYVTDAKIPVSIGLGGDKHEIVVETDGFVYTKKPQSTEEYLAYEFKKNHWILLNANSLAQGMQKNKNEIMHLVDDPVKLNQLIDNSKERKRRIKSP